MPAPLLLIASVFAIGAGLETSPEPSGSASAGAISPSERPASSPIEATPSAAAPAPSASAATPTASAATETSPTSQAAIATVAPDPAAHHHGDHSHHGDHGHHKGKGEHHSDDHGHHGDHGDHGHHKSKGEHHGGHHSQGHHSQGHHSRGHRRSVLTPRKRPLSRRQQAGKAPISVRLKTLGELGSLNVLSHTLQFGQTGTEFDLRRDGRQDTMFLFRRLSAELEVDDHHQIILLYQPISFNTETVLMEDLVADDVTFPAMTGVSLFYGFDIYRLSYAYDFLTDPEQELAIGFSMQVRNFRSSYVSNDGELSVANTNIGAVPIIKLRGRHQLKRANFWYGGEIDGFYANIPYVNGGDDPVEGLIVDASVRAGFTVAKVVRPFANLRYIGGGGKGTSSDKVGFGDGYSSNWLHTMAFSLGAEVTIPAVVGDRKARDREVAARKARRKAKRQR